jgi:BirA family biotin operon repressor/biotin-[acetyl-CoA-carboxylase] ligase
LSNTYFLRGYLSALASHHTCTPPKLSATSPEPSPPFDAIEGPPRTRFAEVRRFDVIDSTNRYLMDEARRGAAEGLVAVADYQTAGKGRLGRRWEAPAGSNLLVSVLLRPTVPVGELHLVVAVVALAAADACAQVAGVSPVLKWPNDLYVGARKLAGILAESAPGAVVVGLGLNVDWPSRAPSAAGTSDIGPSHGAATDVGSVEAQATSLLRELGPAYGSGSVDRLLLLEVLLADLECRLTDLELADGRRRQAAEYRSRCATVGRNVRVATARETFEGKAIDVTDEGMLALEVGGELRTLSAGDVVHVD